MPITLGCISNILMPYCNKVELTHTNGVPLLRAYLSTNTGFTRGYMYVVQHDDGLFSACDNPDDLHGNRFFPSGLVDKPFISEKEVINRYASDRSPSAQYTSIITHATSKEIMRYVFDTLYRYQITKVDVTTLGTVMIDMGFTSTRIKRSIDKAFSENKAHVGRIMDLFDIIWLQHKHFVLPQLRQREIAVIIAKLRDLGITAKCNDRGICDVMIDKRIY